MHPIFSLVFLLILVIALWYYFGKKNHPLDVSDLKTSIFEFLTKPQQELPVQAVSLQSVRENFLVGDGLRTVSNVASVANVVNELRTNQNVETEKNPTSSSTSSSTNLRTSGDDGAGIGQGPEVGVGSGIGVGRGRGRGRGRGLRTSGEGLRTSGEAGRGRGRGLRTSGEAGGLRTSGGGLRTSGNRRSYSMPISGEREFDSRPEALCCSIIEEIYQKPFVKVRPDFLKNPETGHNLELDCYNAELNIAVEYSGYQHYVYPNRFHRMYDDFIKQVRRDQFKVDVCDAQGIYLITVPYWVPEFKLKEFINEHLPENIDKLND